MIKILKKMKKYKIKTLQDFQALLFWFMTSALILISIIILIITLI